MRRHPAKTLIGATLTTLALLGSSAAWAERLVHVGLVKPALQISSAPGRCRRLRFCGLRGGRVCGVGSHQGRVMG